MSFATTERSLDAKPILRLPSILGSLTPITVYSLAIIATAVADAISTTLFLGELGTGFEWHPIVVAGNGTGLSIAIAKGVQLLAFFILSACKEKWMPWFAWGAIFANVFATIQNTNVFWMMQ